MAKTKKIEEKRKDSEREKLGELIRKRILYQFGDLQDFAKEMGIKPSTLSGHLKNPKDKFLGKLKQKGIDIKGEVATNVGFGHVTINSNKDSDEKDEFIRLLREENQRLREEIQRLKKLVNE